MRDASSLMSCKPTAAVPMLSCSRCHAAGLSVEACWRSQITAADLAELWSLPNSIRCLLLPYDENRFQLRLICEHGTIKSDLFSGYGAAIDAARDWQRRLEPPAAQSTSG